MKPEIIYEDKDIIVLYKPAGFPTQSGRVGQQDCVSELTNYVKGGYIGIVHRLDQPVEGLLVFAKTKQAAGSLSAQLTKGLMNKVYYGAADGICEPEGRCFSYLIKDNKLSKAGIVTKETAGAKEAALTYRTLYTDEEKQYSLLRIELETGRFHQIRCQMAGMGKPLLGDSKYGSKESLEKSRTLGVQSTALCACALEFMHPQTGKKMEFFHEPENKIFAVLKEPEK